MHKLNFIRVKSVVQKRFEQTFLGIEIVHRWHFIFDGHSEENVNGLSKITTFLRNHILYQNYVLVFSS